MPEKNKTACKCSSRSCPRHGDCKACQDYHRRVGSRTSCGKTGEENVSGNRG